MKIVGLIITFIMIFIMVISSVIANFMFSVENDIDNLKKDLCINIPEKYKSENLFISYAGFEESIEYDLVFSDDSAKDLEKQISEIDYCNSSQWQKVGDVYSYESNTEDELISAKLYIESGLLSYSYTNL